MSSRYSKPAIQFQKSVAVGMKFRPSREVQTSIREHVLEIRGTILAPRNPDDHLYQVRDDQGQIHEVRGWWLRQYCRAEGVNNK